MRSTDRVPLATAALDVAEHINLNEGMLSEMSYRNYVRSLLESKKNLSGCKMMNERHRQSRSKSIPVLVPQANTVRQDRRKYHAP